MLKHMLPCMHPTKNVQPCDPDLIFKGNFHAPDYAHGTVDQPLPFSLSICAMRPWMVLLQDTPVLDYFFC